MRQYGNQKGLAAMLTVNIIQDTDWRAISLMSSFHFLQFYYRPLKNTFNHWSDVPSGGTPATGPRSLSGRSTLVTGPGLLYPPARNGVPRRQNLGNPSPEQVWLGQVMPRAVHLLRFPAERLSCLSLCLRKSTKWWP